MILWFSGTGNSLHIAAQIASYTNDRLVSIADGADNGKYEFVLQRDERLGVVCPVYFWGLPMVVDRFLANLKIDAPTRPYTYLVLTCGGSACNAVRQAQKHLKIDYYAEMVMPDNYILSIDARPPEDTKLCLRQSETKLGVIYNAIRAREKPKPFSAGPLSMLLSKLFYRNYVNGRKTAPFHTLDRCTNCGLCERVCPDHTIRIVDGRPQWNKSQCELCLACIQRCPQAAIQYGKKTENRTRYSHPSIERDGALAGASWSKTAQ